MTTIVIAAALLGVGTYLMRIAGPLLSERFTMPPRLNRALSVGAVVLLAALCATSALWQGEGFAGPARGTGVAVAGVLAWRKMPFIVVVVAAAAVAAGLRLAGVP